MTLSPGTRLGPYEVVAPLGAGGMGEVFRGRDTSLHRDVAIKVLPAALADDADRLARFEREAQALAALNHPNIAHIYGLEKSGATPAIIMEFVGGEDLSARIARGPVPLAEALPLARQIADALSAAHEAGIIHRDLKPANIKVTDDGTVKVLDFGLAKALDPSTTPGTSEAANSPTLTNRATQMGVILGTAAYMAPEQARGKAVDKRADIWAFGVVLYEMLTGRRPFEASDVSDVLAYVLTKEPDWSALPVTTPPLIRRLLQRCLTKDPKQRLHDIADARLELADSSDEALAAPPSDSSLAPRRRHDRLFGLIAGAVVGAAGIGAFWWVEQGNLEPGRELHAAVPPAPGVTWARITGSGVVLSPDGAWVAYSAREDKGIHLHVRSLTSNASWQVPESLGVQNPFFSPDSREVGFCAGGKVWRVSVTGGQPIPVGPGEGIGGAWASDGFIYLGGSGGQGIRRMRDTGGPWETVTTVAEHQGVKAHRYPVVVPGQQALVFTEFSGLLEDSRLAVLDTATKAWQPLADVAGHDARVSRLGYIVYSRSGTLMVAGFDLRRRRMTSTPELVLDGVLVNDGGATNYGLSDDGSLAFVYADDFRSTTESVWIDPNGRASAALVPQGLYAAVALSPEGGRIVTVTNRRQESDLQVWDLRTKSLISEFTGGIRISPVWTPDGKQIVFANRPKGLGSFGLLYRRAADGSGQEEQVSTSLPERYQGSSAFLPSSFSSQGAKIWFTQDAISESGAGVLDLSTKAQSVVLNGGASDPQVSADEQWIAYSGPGGGGQGIYVRRMSDLGGERWTVATGEVRRPRWSQDGRLLYLEGTNQIRSVSIGSQSTGPLGSSTLFYESPLPVVDFAVSGAGQRLLLLRQVRAARPIPQLVVNWLPNVVHRRTNR